MITCVPNSPRLARGSLRAEDGIAMPIALAVLVIVTLLGGAATMAAVYSSHAAGRDGNDKAALAAADAGLRTATYRASIVQPDATHCVTNAGAVVPNYPAGAPAYCYDSAQAYAGQSADPAAKLGNGSSFQYWMTPPMTAGQACAGLSVVSQVGITQRCVTAIGTSNGVTARTEARLAAYAAQPLFPVPGIVGLQRVTLTNNANASGSVATNGSLEIDQSRVGESDLGPTGHITLTGGGNAGTIVRRTAAQGPFVLAPVDPGNSPTSNDGNARITNGRTGPPTVPFDGSVGITWNAATRALTIGPGASLTLGGGTYNFCSLTINRGTLTVAAGVKTRLFIDSPDRTGSGCAAGTGTFSVINNGQLANPSADPTSLQIYVYGWTNGLNAVTFQSFSPAVLVLYAPTSTLNMTDDAGVTGGIAALQILNLGAQGQYSGSNAEVWDARVAALQARTTGLFYRSAWEQCPAVPTAVGSPQSGC